jgi:hypothetical protein
MPRMCPGPGPGAGREPATPARTDVPRPTSHTPAQGGNCEPAHPTRRPSPLGSHHRRAVQAALAVLALAVLAWAAVAHPAPDPDRLPATPVLIVPETTTRPPAYTPVPAGPPCPASDQPQAASR